MRRQIVIGLERACGWLDDIPGVWWVDGRPKLARHAQYGCWPLRLAQFSLDLDERWGTNAWNEAESTRED